MKLNFLLSLLVIFIGTSMTAQTKNINIGTSSILWVGKKITGSHDGTVNFKSGSLVINDGKLKGGKFVVDMNSIMVTDLEPGKGKEKLEGHLKSDDFFGTDVYPTSTIEFKTIKTTAANKYSVTADLTIKGVTEPITFDVTFDGISGNAKLNIDRTKFGIRYGSGSFFENLGDKAINNEFMLDITVKL